MKSKVWICSLAGEVVSNAKDFADVANRRSGKINVIFVESEVIRAAEKNLTELWEGIQPIPQTQNAHCIVAEKPFKITHAVHSRSDDFKTHMFKECEENYCQSPLPSTSTTNTKEPVVGDFIVAKVMGKSRSKNFIAQVIEKSEFFTEVHFFKPCGNSQSLVVNEKDIPVVELQDVVAVLPTPTLNKRGHYYYFFFI